VDNEVVGNISVEQKGDVYRQDAEIGYFLLPESYSQGIMTEAVRQICKIAFERLNIIRITGSVYEPNWASRKVLEKNDFVLEGLMKKAVVKNGSIYDLCIYGKVK
ncbi:MAG: GNAT family protein, partial [Candidatus Treponema excrementipullorum]|nr:GNAT family protein [Candidatus Treponema excrementipullorum]